MKTLVKLLFMIPLVCICVSCENDFDTLNDAGGKHLDDGTPESPGGANNSPWTGTITLDEVNISIDYQQAKFQVVYDLSKYGKDPLIQNLSIKKDYILKSSKVSKSNNLIFGEVKYGLLNPITVGNGANTPGYTPKDETVYFTINLSTRKVTLSWN